MPIVINNNEAPKKKHKVKAPEPNFIFDPRKTYLVINGKPKEISPKSKYILDMLIIED